MVKKIILTFLFSISLAFGQNSVLDAYVNQALESNLALQQKKLSFEKSIKALKEARGMFLPSVSIEARYSRAGGGREIEFPVGDLLNPVYSSINGILSSLGQPTQNFPVLENELIPFLREEEHETKLRLIQPIFQPAIYYNYKIKNNLSAADSASWAAYKTELIGDVKNAYYSFLQADQAVKIFQNALQLVEEGVEVSQSLVDNGIATKDVLYRSKSEKLQIEQELTSAERQRQAAQNYFNFLLNRDLDEVIIFENNYIYSSLSYTTESAAELALKNRREIRQIEKALTASDNAVSIQTSKFLPQVNLVVDYGYQGEEYSFGEDDDYWMASALLSWNLFNGFSDQAKREQAKIDFSILRNDLQQLKKQIRLQATDAVWSLQESEKQYQQSEEQLKAAKETHKIVARKYSQGMASHIEMIDARTTLTNSELNHNIAKYEILKRQARLKQILGKEGV